MFKFPQYSHQSFGCDGDFMSKISAHIFLTHTIYFSIELLPTYRFAQITAGVFCNL